MTAGGLSHDHPSRGGVSSLHGVAVAGLSVCRADPTRNTQGDGHAVLGVGIDHAKVVRHVEQFVPFFPFPCDERKTEVHLSVLGKLGRKTEEKGRQGEFSTCLAQSRKIWGASWRITGVAQFIAVCSAYILAEKRRISSRLQRPSREKTWTSSRPPRAHGPALGLLQTPIN